MRFPLVLVTERREGGEDRRVAARQLGRFLEPLKRRPNYPLKTVPKTDTGALAEKAKVLKKSNLGNSANWSRILGRRDACAF